MLPTPLAIVVSHDSSLSGPPNSGISHSTRVTTAVDTRSRSVHDKIIRFEQTLASAEKTYVGSGKRQLVQIIQKVAQDEGLDVKDPGYARMFGFQTVLQ